MSQRSIWARSNKLHATAVWLMAIAGLAMLLCVLSFLPMKLEKATRPDGHKQLSYVAKLMLDQVYKQTGLLFNRATAYRPRPTIQTCCHLTINMVAAHQLPDHNTDYVHRWHHFSVADDGEYVLLPLAAPQPSYMPDSSTLLRILILFSCIVAVLCLLTNLIKKLPQPVLPPSRNGLQPPTGRWLHKNLLLRQQALDALPYAIFILDQRGLVTLMNQAARTLVPQSQQLLERPLPPSLSQQLTGVQLDGTSTDILATDIDGEQIQCQVFGAELEDPPGTLYLIDARKTLIAAEQALPDDRRQILISQIAAGTVHEIRNPLTAARGFVQLLSQLPADDELTQTYSELALLEIDRIEQLLKEFALLSQAIHPQELPVDLLEITHNTIALVEGIMMERQILLQLEAAQPVVTILGDELYLQQVLQHLLYNAAEATPPSGTIKVTLIQTAASAQLSIADTGHGMDPETLQRCLDPFYSTKDTGTGLGLAICQRLVTDMGGQIQINSLMNEGTTIILSFPLYQADSR